MHLILYYIFLYVFKNILCKNQKFKRVQETTVSVWRHIKIKINTYLIKQDSPVGFENITLFTALRQAVGRSSKVGSSIWYSCSWNHNTEMWEIKWPKGKTGSVNLMKFPEMPQIWKLMYFAVKHVI